MVDPDPANSVRSPSASPAGKALHLLKLLFCITLALHAFSVSRNWHQGFLIGHEFRQAQTALSIHFIQEDDNYSLAYPTPLFGPPWSIPMEFPLYQWTVARLGEWTGWDIAVAGRTVSLACFYLLLPGLYILTGLWGFSLAARWSGLILVLVTPVYLFYSRTVLIESMALLFSVWFLAAFTRMCRGPSAWWLAATALLASGAALVKVTTFIPWAAAAAVTGLTWSWREWRSGGLRRLLPCVGWGAAAAALPVAVSLWWVRTADSIKMLSPGGEGLTSSALVNTNFGGWSDRVGEESLAALMGQMGHGVIAPVALLVAGLAAVVTLRRQSCWFLALTGWFVATLLVFPVLYRHHDYYFYAIAILPMIGLGHALHAWFHQSRFLWPLFLGLIFLGGLQYFAFGKHYAPQQSVSSDGGSGLTKFIRNLTPQDHVVVVAGQDWASMVPYYGERRALMLSHWVIADPVLLDRNLDALRQSKVSMLITTDQARDNGQLIREVTERFDLDAEVTLVHADSDVRLANATLDYYLADLLSNPTYAGLEVVGPNAPTAVITADSKIHSLEGQQVAHLFPGFSHPPHRYRCQFGLGVMKLPTALVVGAHPDADLWIEVPAAFTQLEYGIGLGPDSFADLTNEGDGVEFSITATMTDGSTERLAWHHLDPFARPQDRSTHRETILLPENAREIRLSTRPGESYDRDWAYWSHVKFRRP